MEQRFEIDGLKFIHCIINNNTGNILISAREPSGRLRNFIVNKEGCILVQFGPEFKKVSGQIAERLKKRIDIFSVRVPTYRSTTVTF